MFNKTCSQQNKNLSLEEIVSEQQPFLKKILKPLALLILSLGLPSDSTNVNYIQTEITLNGGLNSRQNSFLKKSTSFLSEKKTLVTAGPFQKIYNPSIGESKSWYVNDHSFILDRNGTWHLFGITHPEPANPLDEKKFAHATSPSLSGPWKKEPFSLEADFDHWQETHLWAPYTLSENNLYYQFYCAGGSSSQSYRIHLATSSDLWSWKRHPDNPLFIDGFDARDPMVLKEKGEYILYYTATETPAGGNHIVACRKSKDLVHWGSRMTCYTDPSKGTFGGPTESPFVVRRGKSYYLFIGPRPDYVGTDVFVSNTPYHWDNSDLVGHIDSHAAEIIRDKDGSWFVSHAGWGQKGVYLAPLYWQDGLDQEDSSVQEKKKK